MFRLLKTDLYRIYKAKTSLWGFIIGAILASVLVLMYLGLQGAATTSIENTQDAEILSAVLGSFSTKSLFITSFSLSGNFGFLLVIIICLTICMDFRYGTIRNKIIAGESRVKIYFSTLISASILGIAMTLAYVIILFGLGLPILGWGAPFNGSELGYIFAFLGLQIYIYIMYFSVFTCVCMLSKSTTISLVITLVGTTLIFSVVSIFAMIQVYSADIIAQLNELPGDAPEGLIKVAIFLIKNLPNFLKILPSYQMSLMSQGFKLNELVAYIIPSNLVIGSLITLLGVKRFQKSDLK